MNESVNRRMDKKKKKTTTLKPLKCLNHLFPQLKEFDVLTVNITSIMGNQRILSYFLMILSNIMKKDNFGYSHPQF